MVLVNQAQRSQELSEERTGPASVRRVARSKGKQDAGRVTGRGRQGYTTFLKVCGADL